MSQVVATASAVNTVTVFPYRRTMLVSESLIAVAGLAGALQLVTGTYTPPLSDIEPLGLSSWTLPGAWLFVSVAMPSGVAAWLLVRRAPNAPVAVLVASALLATELVVQVPFIGPSALQAVFGSAAIALGALALHARRRGWRSQ